MTPTLLIELLPLLAKYGPTLVELLAKYGPLLVKLLEAAGPELLAAAEKLKGSPVLAGLDELVPH
jgi:hypothetical protein